MQRGCRLNLHAVIRRQHVGEHSAVAFDAALSHRGIFWIEFDQDGVALETIGNETGRAGATERI